MPPIEIDINVEEMHLEAWRRTADRRPQPEIGHSGQGAAGERVVGTIAADPHRVYAKRRMQIVVEPEIGGRKADCPPAPVAGGDAPVDLPEAAEECGRLTRLARFQQFADLGRGIDRRIGAADRLEYREAEAVLGAGDAQQLGGPAPAVAKGAVPADDDVAGPDRADDDFGDEI